MDFRKIKRLHMEYHSEMDRLSKLIEQKTGMAAFLTDTSSDGLCVMFEEHDATGIGLDEFEKLLKQDFDFEQIVTTL